ncbi:MULTISPECIES: FxSxx-COOH cyclophane-containing RiPP peptide [Streptomyces]|uniref:FxSxx-COOH protein n=1 Tax=Streptomyces lichenis TaxID=2306967 RepID=A0ABT0IIP0_9ACTN|nr:FxSxx-COOH cyclophane-containing RiPP peptide [Streptomyces lichenis]MCK8681192.1 FxSxx-COOH protein [Streptomyces lichenis]
MTPQIPAAFAAAKPHRVPLAEIDVRGAAAERKLGRLLPSVSDRTERVPTFNSAI